MMENLEKFAKFLALIVIVTAISGCAGRRPWTRIDDWYREPPPGWNQEAVAVDPRQVFPVVIDKREAAEGMLADRPFRPLAVREAYELIGSEPQQEPGLQFYLVRGVYLNEATGDFYVSRLGEALRVHHSCLGRHPVPMSRAALVVQLSEPPEAAYATCSMDE